MLKKHFAVFLFWSLFVIGNGVENVLDELKEKIVGDIFVNIQKSFISSFLENCTGVKKDLALEHSPDVHRLTLDIWGDQGNKESIKLREVPQKVPSSNYFNKSLPITIFIHGFLSSSEGVASSKIVQQLLIRGEHNVFALNSESLIKISYVKSSNNVFYIGRELGIALANLCSLNDTYGDIHIIGHSLGAHIAGFAGKTFMDLTGYKLARISGLDPAGPCFFHEKPDDRLSEDDAKFVDVIHTDMGVYGYNSIIGDVDFFPNNGQDQPGCHSSYCSHSRSWEFFAESINSPKSFAALSCQNWSDFKTSKCAGNPIAYMGFQADPNARGSYYLRTDSTPPFGKGMSGTRISNLATLLSWFKV